MPLSPPSEWNDIGRLALGNVQEGKTDLGDKLGHDRPGNHCSPRPVANKHELSSRLDLGAHLKNIASVHCVKLPRLVTSERETLGPQLSILGNVINPVIDGLDTGLRPTVKPFRAPSSETTHPANDNEPDRQAEAA